MRRAPLEVASTFPGAYEVLEPDVGHNLRQIAAERSADVFATQVLSALCYRRNSGKIYLNSVPAECIYI